MNPLIEVDFEDFGGSQLEEVKILIDLWQKDRFTPYAFDNFDVRYGPKVCFNSESGYVFLSDEEYQTVMEHDGKLEAHISCGYCGNEGLESDFTPDPKCEECQDIQSRIDACYADKYNKDSDPRIAKNASS